MKTRRISWVLLTALTLTSLSCARSVTGPRDEPWRFMPGHVEPFKLATFRQGRQCWVYLPPGYAISNVRYPVLYLNDGDLAFDGTGTLHANRIAEDLIRRGEIAPLIIVAVSSGPPGQRFMEYTPWTYPFTSYATGGGEAYVCGVRDSLKPVIDRRFRTLPDREHTGMAGFSLGGLISAYALFAHDSTFTRVGAFSPTYGYGYPDIFYSVRHPVGARYYHDTGTIDDNDIQSMDPALIRAGFVLGLDLMSVTASGADHSPESWAHRFPDMLRFLFPPAGAPG